MEDQKKYVNGNHRHATDVIFISDKAGSLKSCRETNWPITKKDLTTLCMCIQKPNI